MDKKAINIEYLDFVKSIAMILVVLAHCMFFYADNPFWPMQADAPDPVAIFVTNYLDYSLIAFFVFASGFLFSRGLELKKKSTLALIGGRAKRLLLPWFFYGILWLVPTYTFFDLTSFGRAAGDSLFAGYKNMLLGKFADVTWFLLMMFWVTLVWILLRFFLAKERLAWGAVMAVGVFFAAHFFLAKVDYYKISQIDQYLLYFFLGAVMWHFADKLEAMKLRTSIILTILLLGATIAGAQFVNGNFWIGILVRAVSAFALLFLGITFSKCGVIGRMKGKRWYQWLREHNMDIYLFQCPALYVYFKLFNPLIGQYPLLCILANFLATAVTLFVICELIGLLRKLLSKLKESKKQ